MRKIHGTKVTKLDENLIQFLTLPYWVHHLTGNNFDTKSTFILPFRLLKHVVTHVNYEIIPQIFPCPTL